MQCPFCQTELIEDRTSDVRIDQCVTCRGVWFDAGELEQFRAGLKDESAPDADALPAFAPNPKFEREHCPRCRSRSLAVGRIDDRVLHRCDRCSGMFVPRYTIVTFRPAPEPASPAGILGVLLSVLSRFD